MTVVQGMFIQLFRPGLAKIWREDYMNRCEHLFWDKEGKTILRCEFAKALGPNMTSFFNALHPSYHGARSAVSGIYVRWQDTESMSQADAQYILRESLTKHSNKPLTGWRVWDYRDGSLYSISHSSYRWGPVARTKDNKIPYSNLIGDHGDLGVYCYKTPELLVRHIGDFMNYPIAGSIELSGRVVEHELGYRAQVAMVKELWITKSWQCQDSRTVALLSAQYKCDVHVLLPDQIAGWSKWYTQETQEGRY